MTAATPTSSTSDRLDYAIVGGGVSGLYVAWRLLTDAHERNAPPPSIAVFETGIRTGGRLLTWLPAGGLRAELGGMRLFAQQELVWNLLPQLGFTGEALTKFWVTGPNLRLLLRGRSSPLDTPTPTDGYDLPDDERGQSAGLLLAGAIQDVLQASENWTTIETLLGGQLPQNREQWDLIKPHLSWRGRRLWDLGLWNLLSDVRSPETYRYICDAVGYHSLASNWNAAEAMQTVLLDFAQNPDYRTLSAGMGALPDALFREATAGGADIRLETRLVSFEAGADGTTLTLAGPDGRFEATAENLFLALPRRALDLLAPSVDFDLQADSGLRSLVHSVYPVPAFKFFLFYEERWWERLGIQHGRSICDLPIRQTFYFAPQPWPVDDPVPPYGLLMASYDDSWAVDYWQGLVPLADEVEQGREELRGALAELTQRAGVAAAGDDFVPAPPPHLHKATDAMLSHAKTQLALLHDIPESDIPDPFVGAYADWALDPFGGGWNFWAPQVDVRDAMERIKTPLGPDRKVYVVGEAYSGFPGWVEGALTSTEVVLQRHLGLSRPSWLPEAYYLGW